ncbi:MAG: LysR family transcriptional regulator [Alphaproteobacteria bacterium]|nr:LysR family transcriptional regulator [Alphaproteobacteria bacterium]
MKPSLVTGATVTRRWVVDGPRTIDFMGEDARVYATPWLVRDIEMTCRDLLLQHLDAGEDSVGTRVELDHVAPTLLGMPVDITATIAEVKGRLVVLDISARDAVEEVARGRHVRFVADVGKTKERLAAKRAKAAAAATA